MSERNYYDTLETRDPQERERALFARLPEQVEHAQQNTSAYAKILSGVDARNINTHEALAQLPVVRKSTLLDMQKERRPFGGFAATPIADLGRVFGSPGPIYEPEARRNNYWRMARALYAAGFRQGDLVHNAFSYHFTPAGSMLESGACALGCPVFPAGVGQTELQVQAITDLRPTGYVGTPSFLNILVEKAADMGLDISSLCKALVSAEALPRDLRSKLNEQGISVSQCYATADLGLIAYETVAADGLIVDEEIIVEIVRPGTGDLVAAPEVGEVVVTTLNPDYPMIRFATGDLSAVLPDISSCGRTNKRIKGWMGRADQTTKVKGMFVHTSQVVQVLKRHPEIIRGRLVVNSESNTDIMTLYCEIDGIGSEALATEIAASLREVCRLRGLIEFTMPGSLPNDGKVIDDIRTYD